MKIDFHRRRYSIKAAAGICVLGIAFGSVLTLLAPLAIHLFWLLFQTPLVTTNAPVKVRGGAMTFRTNVKENSGWNGTGPVCTNADTSYIELKGVSPQNGAPTTLTGRDTNWKMRLFGHDAGTYATAGNNTKEGMLVAAASGVCSGTSGPANSITVDVLKKPSYSAFYPMGNGPDDDGVTKSVRFWNQEAGCGTPGISNTDEDMCERISRIELDTLDANGNKVTYKYVCTDGECDILIGAPSS